MGLTYETTLRNSQCDAFVDLLDLGTMEFHTAADAEVATVTFGNPAFGNAGAVTPGVATANAITKDSDATGNAAAVTKVKIKKADTTLLCTGTVTVTGGGGDAELTNTTIVAHAEVSITSMTVTCPAS